MEKTIVNNLQACIYCKDQNPKNWRFAKRLRDTRTNRKREISIWRYISNRMRKGYET
jgi:hypothetical protein